jgi:hypothetical protein
VGKSGIKIKSVGQSKPLALPKKKAASQIFHSFFRCCGMKLNLFRGKQKRRVKWGQALREAAGGLKLRAVEKIIGPERVIFHFFIAPL